MVKKRRGVKDEPRTEQPTCTTPKAASERQHGAANRFPPCGAKRERRVDARLVVATHRELAQEVAAGFACPPGREPPQLQAGAALPPAAAPDPEPEFTARQALRTRNTPAAALGLTGPAATDDRILDAMLLQPVLVERPIVASPKGVRLCRPVERLDDLLGD